MDKLDGNSVEVEFVKEQSVKTSNTSDTKVMKINVVINELIKFRKRNKNV